jgi:hypothetical protein
MPSAEVDELLEPGSTAPRASGTTQETVDQLPDPAQYKGKGATNTETGERYISNGTRWVLTQPPRINLRPEMREYLRTIAPYDPEGAARMAGQYLMREPQAPIRGRPGDVFLDPVTGEEKHRIERPAESPFAKPVVPTPKDYTAASINEWRKTRTAENPLGDFSVLQPKPKELTAEDIELKRARIARLRGLTERTTEALDAARNPDQLQRLDSNKLSLLRQRALRDLQRAQEEAELAQDLGDVDGRQLWQRQRNAIQSELDAIEKEEGRRFGGRGTGSGQPVRPPGATQSSIEERERRLRERFLGR